MGNSVQKIEQHKDKLKELVREAGLAETVQVQESPKAEDQEVQLCSQDEVDVDEGEVEEEITVDDDIFADLSEEDKSFFFQEGTETSSKDVMERLVRKYVDIKDAHRRVCTLDEIRQNNERVLDDIVEEIAPECLPSYRLICDYPLVMLNYDTGDFSEPTRLPYLVKVIRLTSNLLKIEFEGIDDAMLKLALTRIFWNILSHTGRYKQVEVCHMVIQLI